MTNPNDRQRILTQTRNLKMAQSAHAYLRGSTVKFYEWLDSSRRCQFPDGPPVWICGDCHVGNLGPLADANGMDRPRSRPRRHSWCAGGLSREGAPPCLAPPPFTQ